MSSSWSKTGPELEAEAHAERVAKGEAVRYSHSDLEAAGWQFGIDYLPEGGRCFVASKDGLRLTSSDQTSVLVQASQAEEARSV